MKKEKLYFFNSGKAEEKFQRLPPYTRRKNVIKIKSCIEIFRNGFPTSFFFCCVSDILDC